MWLGGRVPHSRVTSISAAVVALVIGVMLPAGVLGALGWSSVVSAGMLAGMAAYVTASMGGWKLALIVSGPLAVAGALVVQFATSAWIAAVILGLAALGRGLLGAKGLLGPLTMFPITLGFVLGDPPTSEGGLPAWLFVGLVMLGVALFATLVAFAFHKLLAPAPKMPPLDMPRARAFAITSAALVAIAAWCIVQFDLGHAGAWMILTLVVVLQPYVQDGVKKVVQRIVGTWLGFVLAIGFGTITHNAAVLVAIGGVSLVLALVALMSGKRPYWEYATLLTLAIVLMEGASTSIVDTADQRLFATVVAGLAVLVVNLAFAPLAKKHARLSGAEHY